MTLFLKQLSLTLCFFALSAVLSASASQPAQSPPLSEAEVTTQEVSNLIKTLENPEQREQLIRQLKLLTETQKTESPPVQSSAAAMIDALSGHIAHLSDNLTTIAKSIHQLPQIVTWLKQQYTNPEARLLWKEVFINLLSIIGLGYVAFFIVRKLLGITARNAYQQQPERLVAKLSWLAAILVLELLPLAAFAATAYFTAGLLNLGEQTRLAALAWLNAILLARVVIAAGRVTLAVHAPGLRLFDISDESAHYVNLWIQRLTLTPVYGYFALQIALFLGMQPAVYEALIRLLGLLVLGLWLVFVMQNRDCVKRWIANSAQSSERLRGVRIRLAKVWHLITAVYLIIVYVIWAAGVPEGFLFLIKGTALTIVALAIGYGAGKLINQAFHRGFGLSAELKERYPGLQARANRYMPALQTMANTAVYVLVSLAVFQAWGMNIMGWLLSEPGRVLGSTLFTVGAIIVTSFLIWEVTGFFIESYLAEKDYNGNHQVVSARTKTLLTVARKALLIALLVLSTLLVLSELGINIAPLLATAGVLGLAIGFGSQKLVQDVITGVFILLEDLFAVGDVIKVGNTAGLVEAVSIRNVRLRDFSGAVHTIPFSSIDTISNLTKEFSFYVFDIGVAYRENVDAVMEVLKQLGEELKQDPEFGPLMKEPLEVVGVDRFADSAVVIRARIKTIPIKQWTVGREFNRRMKNRFDELGIEIPFPHQTIYFGDEKRVPYGPTTSTPD